MSLKTEKLSQLEVLESAEGTHVLVEQNGTHKRVPAAKIGGGTPNAVQYTAQELTEEQQMQARANLGLYRTQVAETVWLEETTFDFTEELLVYELTDGQTVKEGATYKVTWDGVEYSCPAKSFSAEGMTITYFGNGAVFGGELTDEPFVGAYMPSGGCVIQAVYEGENGEYVPVSATFSVIEIAEIAQKIDPKFLPEGIGYAETAEDVEILPETTHAFDLTMEYSFAAPGVKAGDIYKVMWNGVEYTCVVKDLGGFVGFGNLADFGTFEDTGEPFVAMSFAEDYFAIQYKDTSVEEKTTFSIRATITTIHKIQSRFLNLDEVESAFAKVETEITEIKETALAPFVVTISEDDSGTLVSDKSFSAIRAEARNNPLVYLNHGSVWVPIAYADTTSAVFAHVRLNDEGVPCHYEYKFARSNLTLTETALATATT